MECNEMRMKNKLNTSLPFNLLENYQINQPNQPNHNPK
jgi:hypothetical protein